MDWIEKQALYFANYKLIHREYKASIHLEDKEDEAFWNTQIQHLQPGKYNFIYHSKNNKGNESTGCTQCLKYKEFLSKDFFICIDSDLRLLRGELELESIDFIAQTYAYSWENHYCERLGLQGRLINRKVRTDFNFSVFLRELAKIVYEPLLCLVFASTNNMNSQWNITKFNQCIPTQPKTADLAENGKSYLALVKQNFEETLPQIALPVGFSCKGLQEANAYLHIQGHQLYKLVMHIGSMLCKGSGVAFKSDILDAACQTTGYDEIESLQDDLKKILI